MIFKLLKWLFKLVMLVLGVAFMICWVLLHLALRFKQPTQSTGHYHHGRH